MAQTGSMDEPQNVLALPQAPDAIELDSTDRPAEDVIAQVVRLVREARR